jgi:NAD(P)H-dependent FMN reductase
MQILAISGSRNREGKTAQAINVLCQAARTAGANSEVIFLPELKIERCRQCHPNGEGQCIHQGHCIIEDDFDSIVAKIDQADAVIFATPVYFNDICESMRGLLDRLRRVRFHRILSGQNAAPAGAGIPAVIYCYAGIRGLGAPACAVNMNGLLGMCGFDVVDVILARRQNLEMKIPILEITGRWLASKPVSGPPPAP